MKHVRRALRRRSGARAPQLVVRREVAWHWRAGAILLVFVVGYALAYWLHVGGRAPAVAEDVDELHARIVRLESQLQVANAAQSNLAKEMAGMQDEGMHLKEEVAFYKSILEESGTSGVPKIHSVKLSKGAAAGEYRYQILLVQSGRHDKLVQGSLSLLLNGQRDGKPTVQPVEMPENRDSFKVNFKYYQRVDGVFTVARPAEQQSLQVQYTAYGGKQPVASLTVDLPG